MLSQTQIKSIMGDAHMSSDTVCEESHVSNKQCLPTSANGFCVANNVSSSISAVGNKNSVEDSYVLSLDIGTTTIRAHVYDQTATKRGSGSRKVNFYSAVDQ